MIGTLVDNYLYIYSSVYNISCACRFCANCTIGINLILIVIFISYKFILTVRNYWVPVLCFRHNNVFAVLYCKHMTCVIFIYIYFAYLKLLCKMCFNSKNVFFYKETKGQIINFTKYLHKGVSIWGWSFGECEAVYGIQSKKLKVWC